MRPTFTDEAVFAAAHEQLEELLPGDGSLAERYAALAGLDPRSYRARRAHGGGGHRGGARVDARPGRAARRRRSRPGDRARRALAGVQPLPGRPAQPSHRQRRPPHVGRRAARARDPRGLSRPPRRARLQGAAARPRTRRARGDAGARSHSAVARLRGDRRPRAVHAARGRRLARRSPRSSTRPASSSISITLSPSSGPSSHAGGRRSTRR